eukprot:GABU01004487.1.p1 GENE.GABU01004487.1~~GABU01004487.1.p1  ORF type:complete len:202 (+),score=50.71 GABU01004487.1:116-721(+)
MLKMMTLTRVKLGDKGTDPAKKKKKKKKKAKGGNAEEYLKEAEGNPHPLPFDRSQYVKTRAQDNSILRNLGSWKEGPTTQTNPPVRPISKQYPDEKWPVGVTYEYTLENGFRTKDPGMQKKDLLFEDRLQNLRKAAEVHRQVRKYAQTIARPGIKMVDLCQKLESTLKYITEANGIEAGQAFPTGCSLNHVAAHYTPNYRR